MLSDFLATRVGKTLDSVVSPSPIRIADRLRFIVDLPVGSIECIDDGLKFQDMIDNPRVRLASLLFVVRLAGILVIVPVGGLRVLQDMVGLIDFVPLDFVLVLVEWIRLLTYIDLSAGDSIFFASQAGTAHQRPRTSALTFSEP